MSDVRGCLPLRSLTKSYLFWETKYSSAKFCVFPVGEGIDVFANANGKVPFGLFVNCLPGARICRADTIRPGPVLAGVVEGLQIALVELKRQHPDSYKKSHPTAYRLGQMAARSECVSTNSGCSVSKAFVLGSSGALISCSAACVYLEYAVPLPWCT